MGKEREKANIYIYRICSCCFNSDSSGERDSSVNSDIVVGASVFVLKLERGRPPDNTDTLENVRLRLSAVDCRGFS